MKCGLHIFASRYVYSPPAKSKTISGIIDDIHALRFRPEWQYIISGDHFSMLYLRSLGIFYYAMIDPTIPSTSEDWHNRQALYLQTLAYALSVFKQHPVPTTTIVPTGRYAATCINIYHYPADTVYSILYALAVLRGDEVPSPAADGITKPIHTSETQVAAQQLLDKYRGTITELYRHYRSHVFDEEKGLIRTDVHLSGTKDITQRTCSFYDNVVFWKTIKLASELGIIPEDKAFLRALKSRILKTFWLPKEGYFLEDLSEEGRASHYYSSDWLIVLSTKFLSPANPKERGYFARSVTYIQKNQIDIPLPLQYQHETRAHRQFFIVRLVAASYGGDAIWSFWGLEYIKALLLLYQYTQDKAYLEDADKAIVAFEERMIRDRGFAEVYDKDGRFFETRLYRSVRQTGWIIGFEQARTLRAAIVA